MSQQVGGFKHSNAGQTCLAWVTWSLCNENYFKISYKAFIHQEGSSLYSMDGFLHLRSVGIINALGPMHCKERHTCIFSGLQSKVPTVTDWP